MSELGFETQLLERIARIEAHIEIIQKSLIEISTVKEIALHADQSTSSAHKRIDDLKTDICWTLGMSVTIVGIFASILTAELR